MDKYIEHEAVIDRLTNLMQLQAPTARELIEAIPAADVQPVVRGKWVNVFDIGTVCNQCGYDIEAHGYDLCTDGEPNFCPNCGARMEES